MRVYVSLLFFFLHLPLFAEVINTKTNNFSEIATLYSKVSEPESTLLVFDIDDTLLTMSQPLGGVAWWDWQSGLLKNNKDSEMLFVKTSEELVRLQNLLFNMIKMQVTDEFVLSFISAVTVRGSSIMGLTARGSEHLSVTLTQLSANGFHDNENRSFFKRHGLKLKNNKTSSPGNFDCDTFSRYVTYYQGVMFLDGQEKGPALKCALQASLKTYSTVIFVDDVQHNLDSVQRIFKDIKAIKVINILYTHEHLKEQEFLTNESLQMTALKQWQSVKATMQQNIQYANF